MHVGRPGHLLDAEWTPCSPDEWCADYGDRLSASLFNRRLPSIFALDRAGFVLDPTQVRVPFVPAACVATGHHTLG